MYCKGKDDSGWEDNGVSGRGGYVVRVERMCCRSNGNTKGCREQRRVLVGVVEEGREKAWVVRLLVMIECGMA